MKARALISGTSYGPEALKLIWQAFDAAWAEISGNFGDEQSAEAARERLAHAILAVADADSRDAEALKETALQIMALASGRRSDWLPSGSPRRENDQG